MIQSVDQHLAYPYVVGCVSMSAHMLYTYMMYTMLYINYEDIIISTYTSSHISFLITVYCLILAVLTHHSWVGHSQIGDQLTFLKNFVDVLNSPLARSYSVSFMMSWSLSPWWVQMVDHQPVTNKTHHPAPCQRVSLAACLCNKLRINICRTIEQLLKNIHNYQIIVLVWTQLNA